MIPEYLLNPLFFIGVGLLLISAVAFKLINKTKGAVNSKRIIIIVLLLSSLFSITGVYGTYGNLHISVWYFYLLELFALFTGILYVYLFQSSFFGTLSHKLFSEILILIITASLSYVGFVWVFNFFNSSELAYWFGVTAFTSFLPFLFALTIEFLHGIPSKIYKVWYVDESRPEPDFDKVNIRNIYLLSVDFVKSVNDSETTNMRVKAPHELKFGDWFQSFLVNYNEKYEENPIQYKYLDNTSMGWIFYVKGSLLKSRRMIDPNKSVLKNQLNEKMTIVASRVKINYQ